MENATIPLYIAEQTQELDQLTIATGVKGYALMQRAGAAAFDYLLSQWPDVKSICIFCGTGNNGGDGYVIAKLAQVQGIYVQLIQLGSLEKQQGDALTARLDMEAENIQCQVYAGQKIFEADVMVDAIFGTGLEREVTGDWLAAIEAINASQAPVLAVDIPSGLHADTGCILGASVYAQVTMTFIGRKQGMYTADGKTCCGQIEFNDLEVAAEIYQQISPSSALLNQLPSSLLVTRNKNSHKGDFGHVLIVGGAPGMSGAIQLAAHAALRSGVGLVSVATHPQHAMYINNQRPEIMSHGIEHSSDLTSLIDRADVIVIGPGLGVDEWSQDLFSIVMTCKKLLVIDADGLNLLARNPQQQTHWVLTPHPGEAGRLLNKSTAEIQQDRFKAVMELQKKYGGVCVLKGAGSLICDGENTEVCNFGNPGMASAGMGDVLSGVLGSVIAQAKKQKTPLMELSSFAVCLHALAGDKASRVEGEKGLLASDLFPFLRRIINER